MPEIGRKIKGQGADIAEMGGPSANAAEEPRFREKD